MDSEILKRLSAAADGQLDPSQLEQLQRLLESGQADSEFLAMLELHLQIAERAAPVRAFSAAELHAVTAADSRFTDQVPGVVSQAVSRVASDPSGVGRFVRGRWAAFACGLAVSLLLLLPLLSHKFSAPDRPGVAKQNTPVPRMRKYVRAPVAARIVKKIDCVWDNDRWLLEPPSDFRAGEWISLSSGLLVIEFQSGAQVTLQGPAIASPMSDNALNLHSGGMSAVIPEPARGFTVHTSSGEIIDLGTEFGVLVHEDGTLETHVFKGKVVTRLRADAEGGEKPEVPIIAGEAQFVSASGAAHTTPAATSRFLRAGLELDTRMPEMPPVDRRLVLWLAASGRLQLDEQGRVMCWGDNYTDANKEPEDTWQIRGGRRPGWRQNAMNGHAAIRFGGNRALVSEPVELGASITSTVVFQLESSRVSSSFARLRAAKEDESKTRPDLGLQLLNLFGPPHPVIQIDEDSSLHARVHLGWDPEHIYDNDIGVTQTQPILDDVPHVVTYVVDSDAGTASLYIDGELISQASDVTGLVPTYTPRYLGQHPYRPQHGFPGAIAEVLVHGRALDAAEVGELTSWLAGKYDLVLE